MSERGRKGKVERPRQGITPPMAPKKRANKARILREYIDCAEKLMELGMIEGDVFNWLFQGQCMLNGRSVVDLITTGEEDEITGFLIKLNAWADDEDDEDAE